LDVYGNWKGGGTWDGVIRRVSRLDGDLIYRFIFLD